MKPSIAATGGSPGGLGVGHLRHARPGGSSPAMPSPALRDFGNLERVRCLIDAGAVRCADQRIAKGSAKHKHATARHEDRVAAFFGIVAL